jgi:protein-tyrosine-phosphatase
MRLLFVCTGNICRSAAAHMLVSSWSATTADLAIRSAGTRALPGRPMHKFTAQALERMGIDGRGFTSRRLTARDVEESDLVLTMTAQHRAEVLGLAPRRLRRVFTLVEAAALSEAVDRDHLAHLAPGDRGPALADALADGRAMRRGRPRQDEDILDPVSMPASVHAEVVDRIADTLRSIPLLSGREPGDRSLEQVSAPGRDPRRPRPPFGEPD